MQVFVEEALLELGLKAESGCDRSEPYDQFWAMNGNDKFPGKER